MTNKAFDKAFHGINGPAYRGAPMPTFDPAAINEDRFADELRIKEFTHSFVQGNEGEQDIIEIDWCSQEWNNVGVYDVVEEIKRCFRYIGFNGLVKLTIYERGYRGSGECETYREFEVQS